MQDLPRPRSQGGGITSTRHSGLATHWRYIPLIRRNPTLSSGYGPETTESSASSPPHARVLVNVVR